MTDEQKAQGGENPQNQSVRPWHLALTVMGYVLPAAAAGIGAVLLVNPAVGLDTERYISWLALFATVYLSYVAGAQWGVATCRRDRPGLIDLVITIGLAAIAWWAALIGPDAAGAILKVPFTDVDLPAQQTRLMALLGVFLVLFIRDMIDLRRDRANGGADGGSALAFLLTLGMIVSLGIIILFGNVGAA